MNDDLLARTYERVGEMNAKLDFLLSAQKEQGETLDRHGVRIRKLEQKWVRLTSFLTLLGSGVTVAWNYVFKRNA